jgi:hypothetical protein
MIASAIVSSFAFFDGFFDITEPERERASFSYLLSEYILFTGIFVELISS